MTPSTPAEFLARARHEAERYGSDPWVFVRELLQNARDAGATRVEFETWSDEVREFVSCRDDGSGMTFDHARRYLFTLYASSKRGRRSAGRFGIGFWSILRFRPEAITIRSGSGKGEGWQIRLDGSLERLERSGASTRRGTEIVLERAKSEVDLRQLIRRAVLRDAPFLNQRDRPGRRLEVLVDGEPLRRDLDLPPPSLSFSRRGLRGAVGLGASPGVEIYAHGLRVREASSLEELSLAATTRRPAVPTSGEGLSPRAVIESRRLSVMMARGDAQEDRALRSLVAVGQRELRRLVSAELDRHVGASLVSRIGELAHHFRSSPALRVAAAVIATGLLLALAIRVLHRPEVLEGRSASVVEAGPESTAGDAPPVMAYKDLSDRYGGPDLEGRGLSLPPVELSYRPPDEIVHFAALHVIGIGPDGRILLASGDEPAPYVGLPCTAECLEVEVVVDASPGRLRVPIATGHVIDPESVQLDGQPVALEAGADGLPLLWSSTGRRGRLYYRSSPAVDFGEQPGSSWPPLPMVAESAVSGFSAGLPSDRARAATRWVRQRIAYDTSSATAARHREYRARGVELFDRSISIGGGDCDVQNALLAAMLDRSGITARLAIGWQGVGGRTVSGLHAWVEYLDEGGRWRIADASLGSSAPASGADALGVHGPPDSGPVPWIGASIAAAVALLTALSWAAIRPVWRRRYRGGEETDLSGLLRGAAVRPESFARVPAVFSRPVVPLLTGRSLSLQQAREAAELGRLACGRRSSALARRVAEVGRPVIDLDRPEGSAVAEVFAAVDLDRLDAVLERAWSNRVTERVEQSLAEAGVPSKVRVAADAGEEVSVFDGHFFGLGRDACWVLVDQQSVVWRRVLELASDRPATAALLLGDAVFDRLDPSAALRPIGLRDLAREALAEAARRVR